MRNDSWHGGRYTEYRESREKDSLWWIGRDPNVGVDPLSFLKLPVKSFLKLPVKSIDARLIKAEHMRAVVCLSPRSEELSRFFHSRKVPAQGLH
jgi:hypothetical protein